MAQFIPLILFAGTSLLQAGQTQAAGEIQKKEAEFIAQEEELGAMQREADRKGRLAEALASQSAQAGASGIAAFEGSPLTILQSDIAAEERATERDIFQSRLAALTQRTRGRTAAQQAQTQSLIGLGADLQQLASVAPAG